MAALPILTVPILNVNTNLSDLHYNNNLLYHYAGGIALGVLKHWREAEEFFKIVVSAPAQAAAAIQFEALKKLTLVQLILYGKYTDSVLIKLMKNCPYFNFSKLYLRTIRENWGLVQQTIAKAPQWLIKKLILTYLTLGLGNIASLIGVATKDEVQALILDMIESDEITASISVDGTVTFSNSVAQFLKANVDNLH
ncbi:hypothetical protein BC835DRAFT_1434071 [Cytidiella melzeri]|nr:hypothetical protein BC835DRAFT_1434071 [Cytidiella melzeri]